MKVTVVLPLSLTVTLVLSAIVAAAQRPKFTKDEGMGKFSRTTLGCTYVSYPNADSNGKILIHTSDADTEMT